ncbi:hypothetical protein FUA48_16465 [Flavobacterium alkalisoli]|uniref:Uncharacterized protein n=1 Tax=Flavobacterium alkalisoli TaxID=2602769 RepID=A0A5B9FXL1_9FLAO|nr:hypothetical protein [Flavobacterium alkalisoli]QEE51109.1 hypothetical protein FUA48_16465 [Flavobacterium alkalisoli]
MKTMRKLLLLLMLLSVPAAFVSCEEEETTDVSNDACLDQLETLSDILYEKTLIFSNNATPSTCSAVRTAALNLINAAEDCGYGYLYTEQTQFWLDYDCSVFD